MYRLGEGVQSIAAVLSQHGYRTGAFVSNGDLAVRDFGLAEQFDYVNADHLCESGPCAEALNGVVLEWTGRPDRAPWFAYVHYMDVHYPYDAPPEWADRFATDRGRFPVPTIQWMRRHGRTSEPTDAELAYIEGMYDAEIAYLDAQICSLLSTLRERVPQRGLFVVVASDHGDEFFEHGGFGHKRTLYEELVACPLLLVWQEHVPAGVRVDSPVQNVDVVPTILELLDLPGAEAVEGASLKPFLLGERLARSVFSEKQGAAVWRGEWKLWEDARGDARLYHLGSDPAERTNRAATDPDTLASLSEELARWRGRLNPPRARAVEAEPRSLDPDKVEMLRRLGYLD
jgi:arylsulfatase A-like enzyme